MYFSTGESVVVPCVRHAQNQHNRLQNGMCTYTEMRECGGIRDIHVAIFCAPTEGTKCGAVG